MYKNEYLEPILIEMCKRVNVPFSVVNSSENWYEKYSWTEEEENDFKEWLVDYLQKNKKTQRELYGWTVTGKKLKERVECWVSNYGWVVLPIKVIET